MANIEPERLEETFFKDQNWIASNGGWLHSNNVLFYFGISPFCEGTSKNTSIFVQSVGIQELVDRNLCDKKTFESRLKERPGVEYVVAHDPLESKTVVQGPMESEQSRTWVIKKQNRDKSGSEDIVTPLAYYYIINDTIFQAPRAADILTNRLLTTVTSLSNLLSETASLPVFSPSYGHTYFPPIRKPTASVQTGFSQRSKDTTPLPGSQVLGSSQGTSSEAQGSTVTDAQTLVDAIRMTMRYGKDYMDESPLVGEPGNFRLSKHKEALVPPTAAGLQAALLTSPPKDKSQTPAKLPPSPPKIQTDVPPVNSKKSAKGSDRSPTTPGGTLKPKRRKSKVGGLLDL